MTVFNIHDQHKMNFPSLGIKSRFKDIEGTHAHVGADRENLTLPYGIVADSVNVNVDGTVRSIRAGRNNLTSAWVTANESQIDYASASKTIFGQTYRARDYMEEAKNDPKKAISLMTDDMIRGGISHAKSVHGENTPDKAMGFLVSHYWNAGENARWGSVTQSMEELSNDSPNLRSAAFRNYAENTATGGRHVFGLFKRRLADLNESLPRNNNFRVIEAARRNGTVYFNAYDKDGNMVMSWPKPAGTGMPRQPVIDLETDRPPRNFRSQFTNQ